MWFPERNQDCRDVKHCSTSSLLCMSWDKARLPLDGKITGALSSFCTFIMMHLCRGCLSTSRMSCDLCCGCLPRNALTVSWWFHAMSQPVFQCPREAAEGWWNHTLQILAENQTFFSNNGLTRKGFPWLYLQEKIDGSMCCNSGWEKRGSLGVVGCNRFQSRAIRIDQFATAKRASLNFQRSRRVRPSHLPPFIHSFFNSKRKQQQQNDNTKLLSVFGTVNVVWWQENSLMGRR